MPSMPSKGPISFQGGGSLPAADAAGDAPVQRFRIINATDTSCSGPAHVHPDSCEAWAPFLQGRACHAALASGSDCVALLRPDNAVPPDCMAVPMPLMHSMHMCAGETYDFRLFAPPEREPFQLTDIAAEVRLLLPLADSKALEVDERRLAEALIKQHLGCVVAVGQLLIVHWNSGAQVVARITSTNTVDAAAQEDAVGYHCFRGLLAPDTTVMLDPAPDCSHGRAPSALGMSASSLEDRQSGAIESPEGLRSTAVRLTNRQPRTAGQPSAAIAQVHTNDGEVFPVNRKLLRPCIALTAAVRSDEDAAVSVDVDVGTLTFDRVLIFLEAQALGRPAPDWAVHLLPELLAAAQKLGLRSLEEACSAKLGQKQSRLRVYSWAEIKAANASGLLWLLMDGMIFDVTRWLPEHPGGDKIIGAQALNLDACRFFEVYHSSRESFLYLQEFYIGEIAAEDAPLVPRPQGEPSADFMQQLRDYTAFRMPHAAAEPRAFKSF